MQYYSNLVMVDDVLYALSSTGWLTLDTNTDTAGEVAFSGGTPDTYSRIYEADGKLWAVSSDWYLHCLDPADGAPCDHDGWTNGKSTDQATTSASWGDKDAVVEYRNTDGSFGGFCIAHGQYFATYACLNADGVLDPNAGQPDAMVNPFEQMQSAMGNQDWHNGNYYGNFIVSRQHQVIIYEPRAVGQDYFCWDYTTQAACANFTPSDDNLYPGEVYTIVQDPWIDNCFWSNSHDSKIGVWDTSHTGGFATSGGECVVTAVVPTVTLTYDPQGGTGEPGDQTGDAASDVTVSTTAPTRSGYTFTGWNTAADGSGTSYAGNDSYTLPNSGTDTLYAQWSLIPVYNVMFDANGGTGAPAALTCSSGNVTLPTTPPTRSGYTFAGWNTAADGSGSLFSTVTGVALEGPSGNQTGTNLFDIGKQGWLSLNEPVGAGQRIVFDTAWVADLIAEAPGPPSGSD
ncbi:MAG: InlB B-repeat-containing protein, partial [Ilumatobacteraceae bacterium]